MEIVISKIEDKRIIVGGTSLNPNQTFLLTLALTVFTFILLFLLPSLMELKKPRDAGPRRIEGASIEGLLGAALGRSLRDMEQSFGVQAYSEAPLPAEGLLVFLPSLEP